jgi:PilZ domain-containing protein
VACRRGDAGEDVAVALLDLSEDGACLLLSEAPREGEEVVVSPTTPGSGPPLDRAAAVAWVVAVAEGSFCAGVRFVECLPYADVPRFVRP